MSEPTPIRPDPSRPAVEQPEKGGDRLESDRLKTYPTAKLPVAKRLEPAAKDEVVRLKSSRVISKSYRVLELPPPPVIVPPRPDRAETDDGHRDTLPEGLTAPPERPPEPSIELGALQIRTPGKRNFLRRGVRIPPRWEQWLADPQRRNSVGVGLSLAIHVAIVVLLALVLRVPTRTPATEPIQARTVQPAGGETAPEKQDRVVQMPESMVRQLTAGALETVAIEPPADLGSETSDLKSNTAAPGPDEQKAKIEPPLKTTAESNAPQTGSEPRRMGEAGLEPHPTGKTGWEAYPTGEAGSEAHPMGKTGWEAHPTLPPGGAAQDPVPGMAGGSGMPPDLLRAIDTLMQGKLKRRTPGGRSEGVRYKGGTTQSEEAVERALGWLAAHQRQDGSWNFNHLTEACQHYCTNPGSEGSTTASTGLALLPFLGAGYTHKEGTFRDVVQHGLDYLKSRGVRISYGNDLRDGSMYGHALATIALCEAYGMTRDADLKEAAQGGLDYIAYAQDGNTGGWRYNPGEPGDTTVTGWMLMALKSGQMARLEVKSPTIISVERFLDSVQNKDGSQYGYQSRQCRPPTTAVALLCRMYTGWRRDNPGLVQGVANLNAWGPLKDSLYYDYYATQVLFHWAGPEWDTWNAKMREHLISTQEREGHPSGSWYFESQQSAAGGRLYNTAVATMILEVYYRFMPLYGEDAVEQR